MSRSEISELENVVNNIGEKVLNHVKDSRSTCSGDQLIKSYYNCLNMVAFNYNQLNTNFENCLTAAYDEQTIRKCIKKAITMVNQLENKVHSGKACPQMRECSKKEGHISNNTVYCFAHTQPGTGQKCMAKLKQGKLSGMSHAAMNKMIGGLPGKDHKGLVKS